MQAISYIIISPGLSSRKGRCCNYFYKSVILTCDLLSTLSILLFYFADTRHLKERFKFELKVDFLNNWDSALIALKYMVYFNSKPIENWSIFSLIYKSCIPHFLSVYRRYITNWVVGQPQTRSFLLKWQFGDFVLEWFSPLSFESLNAEKALSVRNGPGSNNHLDFTKAYLSNFWPLRAKLEFSEDM